MINTVEELRSTTAGAVMISAELLKELEKSGIEKLSRVNAVGDGFLVKRELINEVITALSVMSTPKKNKGGRPRIEESSEGLVGRELLKYKNRIWKRNSRARKAKE